MNIIWKLTIRQLKQKKKRAASVILGITIASFLLTIAVIFIHSVIQEMSEFDMIDEDFQKLVVGAGVLMAAILASLTLFIYHILSVSASEKIRQLAILGSVGATPFQRAGLMFYETLILSMIGLPTGLVLGILSSRLIFPFAVTVSWNTLFLLLVFESFIIIISGLIHAGLSMKGNVIQLLLNRTDKRKLTKNWKSPRWVSKYLGVEGGLAAKNLYFFRRRYGIIAVSFIVSMILFLDGFIYLSYLDGNYEPEDPRIKDYADIILEEKNGQKFENWLPFTEEAAQIEGVEEAVNIEETRLGDVLFQKTEIKEDLDTFTTFSFDGRYRNPVVLKGNNTKTREGYYLGVTLIGMDDHAFSNYQKQLNIENKIYDEKNGIPVIAHGMILAKKGKQTKYRQVFDLKEGQAFSILANGSFYEDYNSVNIDEEFSEYSFQTIAATDELPSNYSITNEQMCFPNEVLFFTSQSFFDKFLETFQPPKECEGWNTSRFLCLKIKNDVSLPQQILSPQVITGYNSWRKTFKLNAKYLNTQKGDELRKLAKRYSSQIGIVSDKISDISGKYNLTSPLELEKLDDEQWYKIIDFTITHYAAWLDYALTDPVPVLKHLFAYTLLAFLVIIGSFQMIKMIISTTNIRRREFAVMLSLGMEPISIRKMVCMESVFCLLLSYIIGCISSIAIGFYLFRHWTRTQAIEVLFPYRLLIWEFIFLLLMIVLMLYISVKSVKKINITDLLKEDAL